MTIDDDRTQFREAIQFFEKIQVDRPLDLLPIKVCEALDMLDKRIRRFEDSFGTAAEAILKDPQ